MFGEKLRLLRENKGLTQTELAALLHLSSSSVAMYEMNKREPNFDTLINITKHFDVSLDYLLGNDPLEYKKSTSKYITINVYGFIPAGVPLECIENIVDTEDISADMLHGDKQYFGLKIHGDSMEPEYKNNDTIIVLKTNDCENGQDCVVMVNGYERHIQACS